MLQAKRDLLEKGAFVFEHGLNHRVLFQNLAPGRPVVRSEGATRRRKGQGLVLGVFACGPKVFCREVKKASLGQRLDFKSTLYKEVHFHNEKS